MPDARALAVTALLEVERDGAYSNLTLNRLLAAGQLNDSDRALASRLFYGVLDRRITLDYLLSGFINKPLRRIAPLTLTVLRLAMYQILYMERIPDSAAVNEAVRAVKRSRERFNAAFVNAVLRRAAAGDLSFPQGDSTEALCVRYSCPEWMIDSFLRDYGREDTVALLEEMLKTPPVVLRVNPLRTTAEALAARLAGEGVSASPGPDEGSVTVTGGIDVRRCAAYQEGLFHVQDAASSRSVIRLAPRPGERLLDLCAAPGGKSFTAAGLMENRGEICALDLYEKRAALVTEGAKRLGFTCIRASAGDATVLNAWLGQFDAVLCDVPCSGLGVVRRKPEIKYKSPAEFDALLPVQQAILANAAAYLRPGGRLLYSTCTLRRAENEGAVKTFLDNYGGFAVKYEHTYLPHIDGTDGFYCALLEKRGE